MSSAAILLGYGTKIVSSPTAVLNQSEYRELLGIPEDYSAAAVLLVGYADETVDETADGYTGATGRSEFDSENEPRQSTPYTPAYPAAV